MPYKCPKCGSDRITKYSLYLKSKKSGKSGGGCTGCLLFIIILIIAPGLVLLFGAAAGATIYALRNYLLTAAIVGLLLAIILKAYQSGLFICEKCGYKFK